jgi:hypothetical protein
MVEEAQSSPVRDESPVVPDGSCMAPLAGRPSDKWLGYFRETSAKMNDWATLQDIKRSQKDGVKKIFMASFF